MPSRDFLINDLTRENGKTDENPNGWTKEDIESYVNDMSPIDLDMRANERKQKIYDSIQQENDSLNEKRKLAIKTSAENMNTTSIPQSVDKLFEEMASLKDIGGIPHTAEDQAAFKQMFLDSVSINPETGLPRTNELFNDNKVLYEVMYLYNKIHQKGEGSLRNFLSTFKEEYKQDILDKTGVSPRELGGSFHMASVPKPGDYI